MSAVERVEVSADAIPADVPGMRSVLEAAQGGDTKALANLKGWLADRPETLVKLAGGDMAEMLQNRVYAEGFASGNPLHREGVRTHLGLMRGQLLAGGSSFVEQVVVDSLLVAWSQVMVTGMLTTTAATLRQKDHLDKRHDRAFKRMMVAARTLASIRRVDVAGVLAAIQQNGETNNVNVAVKL